MSVTITFPDARVFLNPYSWRTASGAAICPWTAYMKFTVTGTTAITANVDTTINNGMIANDMPTLKSLVSPQAGPDGPYVFHQLPANNNANTPITLASGLDGGTTYNVTVYALVGNSNAGSGWTDQTIQTKINNLQFDNGSTITAPVFPFLRPKKMIIWGASYEEAYFGGTASGPWYTYIDYSLSWPFFVAWALGCEYAQIGIGGQGWVHAGAFYPAFPSSWDFYDSAHAKTFSPAPDYVLVHQAENDSAETGADVQAAVTSWIPAARSALGQAKIFIGLSITQIQSAAIIAGAAAAADSNTHIIDPGNEFLYSCFNTGSPITWASPDGIHLDSTHQGIYNALMTAGVLKTLGAVGGGAYS